MDCPVEHVYHVNKLHDLYWTVHDKTEDLREQIYRLEIAQAFDEDYWILVGQIQAYHEVLYILRAY